MRITYIPGCSVICWIKVISSKEVTTSVVAQRHSDIYQTRLIWLHLHRLHQKRCGCRVDTGVSIHVQNSGEQEGAISVDIQVLTKKNEHRWICQRRLTELTNIETTSSCELKKVRHSHVILK